MAEQVKQSKEKAEAGTQAVATRPWDASKFLQVVANIRKKKSKNDETKMALASEYSRFEELVVPGNKAALKLAMKIDAMEPATRFDFLTALKLYGDALGTYAQQGLALDDTDPAPRPPEAKTDADAEPAHEKPIDMTGKLGEGKGDEAMAGETAH